MHKHECKAGPASNQEAVYSVIIPLVLYIAKFVYLKSNKLNVLYSSINCKINSESYPDL